MRAMTHFISGFSSVVLRFRTGRRTPWLAVAFGLGAFMVAGCFNPFDPLVAKTTGISQQAPEPSSAVGVLRLYEWCWNHRDPDLYRELFTDDYQFQFATTDTAGNAYRDRALNREEELDIALNIFVRGNSTTPPPTSISLVFDPNLVALPDSRLGKDGRVHKEIAAQTLLRFEEPAYEVDGTTRFFVVRGDSALLPQELIDRGFRRDSTRWFIERVEDETLDGAAPMRSPGAARTRRVTTRTVLDPVPAHQISWGQVRAWWDERPAGSSLSPSFARSYTAMLRFAPRQFTGRLVHRIRRFSVRISPAAVSGEPCASRRHQHSEGVESARERGAAVR